MEMFTTQIRYASTSFTSISTIGWLQIMCYILLFVICVVCVIDFIVSTATAQTDVEYDRNTPYYYIGSQCHKCPITQVLPVLTPIEQ